MGRLRRRLVIAGLASSLLLLLLVAGGALWLLFFTTIDAPYVAPLFPPPGALIQESRQHFEFGPLRGGEHEFRLFDSNDRMLHFHRTRTTGYRLPYGLLQPGRHYRWVLHEIDADGWMDPEPVAAGDFRVAGERREVAEGGETELSLFPGQLVVRPREILRGLALEVSASAPFAVSLPPSLVFTDGQRFFVGEGAVILHLRFEAGAASADAAGWGEVAVSSGPLSVTVPVVPGARTGEAYSAGVGPPFSPYRDTPSFSNFSASLLGRITQGTCVGIALAVKLFFERVRFGADNIASLPTQFLTAPTLLEAELTSSQVAIPSSVSFRDLAAKRPQLVMELMSALHFENLNPRNVWRTLMAALSHRESQETGDFIWAELATGRLPVIGAFRLQRRVFKAGGRLGSLATLDSGHAILAYRGWRFGELMLFAVYDPNFEYLPDQPRSTLLLFRPGERPVYFVDGIVDRTMVRFLPVASGGVLTYAAILGHDIRGSLREWWRTIGDEL